METRQSTDSTSSPGHKPVADPDLERLLKQRLLRSEGEDSAHCFIRPSADSCASVAADAPLDPGSCATPCKYATPGKLDSIGSIVSLQAADVAAGSPHFSLETPPSSPHRKLLFMPEEDATTEEGEKRASSDEAENEIHYEWQFDIMNSMPHEKAVSLVNLLKDQQREKAEAKAEKAEAKAAPKQVQRKEKAQADKAEAEAERKARLLQLMQSCARPEPVKPEADAEPTAAETSDAAPASSPSAPAPIGRRWLLHLLACIALVGAFAAGSLHSSLQRNTEVAPKVEQHSSAFSAHMQGNAEQVAPTLQEQTSAADAEQAAEAAARAEEERLAAEAAAKVEQDRVAAAAAAQEKLAAEAAEAAVKAEEERLAVEAVKAEEERLAKAEEDRLAAEAARAEAARLASEAAAKAEQDRLKAAAAAKAEQDTLAAEAEAAKAAWAEDTRLAAEAAKVEGARLAAEAAAKADAEAAARAEEDRLAAEAAAKAEADRLAAEVAASAEADRLAAEKVEEDRLAAEASAAASAADAAAGVDLWDARMSAQLLGGHQSPTLQCQHPALSQDVMAPFDATAELTTALSFFPYVNKAYRLGRVVVKQAELQGVSPVVTANIFFGNDGRLEWLESTKLLLVVGPDMGLSILPLGTVVQPGASVELGLQFQIPTSEAAGTVLRSGWVLENNNEPFGPLLLLEVHVI